MAKFDDYTQKNTPEDNDITLILDKTANVNKKTPFSGIWTWIVNKMTNAVIQNLQTTNKTVIGAINELNSKTFLLGKSISAKNTKNLNNINDGIYFYNGWGWDSEPPTNGTAPFINDTGIWIRMTLDASTVDVVIAGKDAKIYTSKDKTDSWTAK